jgi:hypothetical protein
MVAWNEFVGLARDEFSFLENQHGFRCVSEKLPFVVYESSHIQIAIYYEPNRRCELDLGLKRLSDVGKQVPSYGLSQFMRLKGVPAAEISTAPFPEERGEVIAELQRLAHHLKMYGDDALQGKLEVFDEMDARSRKSAS